jgi:hypothetical protein
MGVCKGSILSQNLFNTYLDKSLKSEAALSLKIAIKQLFAFAEDIAI